MYRNICDSENSWDESTKEEADEGGEADEDSVSSQHLWKVGTGSLQQTACISSNFMELFNIRDDHQTSKTNGQDSVNSDGLTVSRT